MNKREKLILKHLKSLKETKKRLPEKYQPIEEITQIHYGFQGRKTIRVEEIAEYKNKLC